MLKTDRGPRDAYSQGRGRRRRHGVVLGDVFASERPSVAAGQRHRRSAATATAGGGLGGPGGR